MRRNALILIVSGLAIVAAACGGSNKVGNNALLNVQDKVNSCRVGECTTTTAAPVATTAVANANLGIKPATTLPTATTVAREQVIVINSDTVAKGQFDPNAVTVFTKYPVRFQNNDTVARSVVFADRRSPLIAPGASWTTTFAAAGAYPYQDGTRPYATASIQVVAR